LARAVTGRAKIIKFTGCYHGHADSLLVQAGSGVATLGLPDSPGVPAGATADTLTVSYNDLAGVESLCEQYADEIAAVIVEPVAGNMGLVLPNPEFLPGLRAVTTRIGALLIFDEVMTGFRVAPGGAQAHYGIAPDITCLGKVIGGGLPAAAYGGRRDVMQHVAPAGSMYQAGTLSGNPLAMAAGVAMLDHLAQPGTYDRLATMAASLASAVRDAAGQAGVPVQSTSIGSMWGFFCTDQVVTDYASAKTADTERYGALFHALLNAGVYLAPSQFEAAFVSTAHNETTLGMTKQALSRAFEQVSQG
jgi:glutamate-1-semialdehyde 2,1-aminomutase